MVSVKDDDRLLINRHDFGKFFKEHDKRRGTDFKKVFPELAEFYEYTQTIKI